MTQLVQQVEKLYKKSKLPKYDVGDTVKVHMKIIEGGKERIQIYQGLVIAKNSSGVTETFTVYRVSFGYANEKVFPVHNPNLVKVEVLQKGKVRRAKLNFIRGKLGKKAKIATEVGATLKLQKSQKEEAQEAEAKVKAEAEAKAKAEAEAKAKAEAEARAKAAEAEAAEKAESDESKSDSNSGDDK